MEYKVRFDFTILKDKDNFVGKSGEIKITTDKPVSPILLKEDDNVKHLICQDLATKTKSKIVTLDIIEVIQL